MKLKLTICYLFLSLILLGQQTDTITFYSKAFQADRSIYITTPAFFKYQSETVQLPVFFILDGQHEWFVNPVTNAIRYLQYTKEVPAALTIVIPLDDRMQACAIPDDIHAVLPLHDFITKEIPTAIAAYRPGSLRILIGHSFSASFALYSYHKAPDFYHAVMSHTPLDRLDDIIAALQQNQRVQPSNIYLSTGSVLATKDIHHRAAYDELKMKYADFFQKMNTYEANYATHNAVPIVATPIFLNKMFFSFSTRHNHIAPVNENYEMTQTPQSVEAELAMIQQACYTDQHYITPELPEINGIASRFQNNGYTEHARTLYEWGITLYPNDFGFYLSLAELLHESDLGKTKVLLTKALELLQTVETDLAERDEMIAEINDWLNN